MNDLSERLDTTSSTLNEAKLRTKARTGFAVAIILTCLLGLLSWRMAQQATEDAKWVAHTTEAELDRGATFYFTLGGSEVIRSRSDAATAGS
jgi:hypothetical protein